MPKPIIISAKIVNCTDNNILVIKAYNQAISEWGAEYKTVATSAHLNSEEKNVKGCWAMLKREIGLINGTKTWDLPEIAITIEGIARTYYDEFKIDLERELDRAILSGSGKKPDNVSHEDKLKNSQAISKMKAAKEINDHDYLIYILILRMVAVALSDEFKDVDPEFEKLQIKGFMKLLKNFVDNLVKNPAIFVTKNFILTDYISTFGFILRHVMVPKWIIPLNVLIEQNKFMVAPKLILSDINLALDVVDLALQSYQSIIMSEIYYLLFSSNTDYLRGIKLIKTTDQLHSDSGKKTLSDFLDLLLQKINGYKFPTKASEAKNGLVENIDTQMTVLNDKTIEKFEQKNATMDDRCKRLEKDKQAKNTIIVKLNKILAHYSGSDESKNILQRYIAELKALFDIHEKLFLIKEAVKTFIEITATGGWFPILLGIVRPHTLAKAIKNFIGFCQPIEKRCQELICRIADPVVQQALIQLPAMELTVLENNAQKLIIIQTKEIQDKVRREFRFNEIALFKLQEDFEQQGLLMKDEIFVTAVSTNCLQVGNSVGALIDYTERRSRVNTQSQPASITTMDKVVLANLVPK